MKPITIIVAFQRAKLGLGIIGRMKNLMISIIL